MICKDCLYCYADVDERGHPTSREYCHYFHDDNYAPCEVDDNDAEREPALDESLRSTSTTDFDAFLQDM